jgi:hypothetical protein
MNGCTDTIDVMSQEDNSTVPFVMHVASHNICPTAANNCEPPFVPTETCECVDPIDVHVLHLESSVTSFSVEVGDTFALPYGPEYEFNLVSAEQKVLDA